MTRSVAHIIAPGPYGGAESVVKALARGRLGTLGDVNVITTVEQPDDHPYIEGLHSVGVSTSVVPIRGRHYLAEARAVEHALHKVGARLVHTHGPHADLVGYMAARRAGLPVVSTLHGFTLEGWLRTRLFFTLARRFDANICVSASVLEEAAAGGIPRSRLHLVPNGVMPTDYLERADARRALGLTTTGTVAGWIGRMSLEKGPDQFVEALSRVTGVDIEGVMIGDGPEFETVQRQVSTSSGPPIRLTGALPDPARLMRALDVLVISSRSEGLPIVLLDAMAAGVPVVAFSVGGIAEAVSPDGAWVVDPGRPDALAEAIVECVARADDARRRANRAREYVSIRFGLDTWVRLVEDVYDTIDRRP